jgi:hypothetical protein
VARGTAGAVLLDFPEGEWDSAVFESGFTPDDTTGTYQDLSGSHAHTWQPRRGRLYNTRVWPIRVI